MPSNLALHKFGARKWIARIMFTWGIISACTALVQGPASFYIVRFLLGAAEAGFFPGMILYLSYWFPARERARAVGFFMSAIAISYAIGAPISGGIMSVFGGVARPRRLAVAVPDRGDPGARRRRSCWCGSTTDRRTRSWLRDDEKRWLAGRLESEEEVRLTRERHTVAEALKDPRVLVFGALYFCMVVNVYGISFWVGEIVDKVGGLSDVGKGFVTAIPYARRDHRAGPDLAPLRPHRRAQAPRGDLARRSARWRSRVSTIVSPIAAIAALTVGLFFLLGAHPVFWAMPSALLSGAAAAAGIALVNSIGNLGGFVGPYLVGLMKDATGSTDAGLVTLAVLLGIGAFLATRVAHDPAVEHIPRERGGASRAPRPARSRRSPSAERADVKERLPGA